METIGSFWNICSEDNFEQALKLLKEELFVVGYPVFVNLDWKTDLKGNGLISDLINVSWNLIREIKTRRSEKKEMLQHHVSNGNKIELSQKELEDMRNRIAILEKQKEKQYSELQHAILNKEKAEKDVAIVKNEIGTLKKTIENKNHQHSIHLRKKEVEFRALQGKRENLLKTENKISGRVDSEGIASAVATNKEKNESNQDRLHILENMHKKIVCKLEKTIENLVEENINIRNLMEKLGMIIVDLHRKITSLQNEHDGIENYDLPEHIFHLSSEEIKDAVDSYFHRITQRINSILDNLRIM